MRKIFNLGLILITFVLLNSCFTSGGYDNIKCQQSVQKSYPNAIVFAIPDEKYSFIVVDTCGEVRYVKTMSTKTTEITHNILIKPCDSGK